VVRFISLGTLSFFKRYSGWGSSHANTPTTTPALPNTSISSTRAASATATAAAVAPAHEPHAHSQAGPTPVPELKIVIITAFVLYNGVVVFPLLGNGFIN